MHIVVINAGEVETVVKCEVKVPRRGTVKR